MEEAKQSLADFQKIKTTLLGLTTDKINAQNRFSGKQCQKDDPNSLVDHFVKKHVALTLNDWRSIYKDQTYQTVIKGEDNETTIVKFPTPEGYLDSTLILIQPEQKNETGLYDAATAMIIKLKELAKAKGTLIVPWYTDLNGIHYKTYFEANEAIRIYDRQPGDTNYQAMLLKGIRFFLNNQNIIETLYPITSVTSLSPEERKMCSETGLNAIANTAQADLELKKKEAQDAGNAYEEKLNALKNSKKEIGNTIAAAKNDYDKKVLEANAANNTLNKAQKLLENAKKEFERKKQERKQAVLSL